MYLFRFYHTHFHDFHIEPMKLISWVKQSIPESYLDHVSQSIFVRDTDEEKDWIRRLGKDVSDCYYLIKEWDRQDSETVIGVNDPDFGLILVFLDTIWETAESVTDTLQNESIQVNTRDIFNRVLLETVAHELRHIAQQNDLVYFEYMEEDAYDFGAFCFESNPASVLRVD